MDDTDQVIDRISGEGRYAVTEREQRWLLRRLPEGLTNPVEITDTYLRQSTLRLRRARDGSTVVHKLGQKVRHDPFRPSLVQLTNMYLTEQEFTQLARLKGGHVLTKTRWRWTVGAVVFSVDEFGAPLQGLVLAEIELDLGVPSPPRPPLAVADVTEDDRFSGGRLASLTSSKADGLMASVARLTDPHAEK
jgi:CYTH domain-containing protein